MSENNFKHILIQEGILSSFSISKKISIKNIEKKIKSAKGNEELIKKILLEEANKSVNDEKVPGLLEEGNLNVSKLSENEQKLLMDLTLFCSIITKKLVGRKLDKIFYCYVINTLVNMLQLGEKDFENFHKKFITDDE